MRFAVFAERERTYAGSVALAFGCVTPRTSAVIRGR